MKRIAWHPLKIAGKWNPKVRDLSACTSGAYAIRDAKTHRVVYVGESSRGVLRKTLLRHFHASKSFREQREGFVTESPERYEVAIRPTSKGRRSRASGEPADQAAMTAQAEWISRLKPSKNKDDGLAGVDAAEDFRAHRAKQEAEDRDWFANPRNAFDEGMALEVQGMDLLRPHLYGGKPITERSKAKGIALLQKAYAAYSRDEYLTGRDAGLLDVDSYRARHRDRVRVGAELRSLGAPNEPAPPAARARTKKAKPAPAPKPEGYGSEDEKREGQIRMFNPSPAGPLKLLGKLTELVYSGGTLRWSLREAPDLGYDQEGEGARLFIVYTGKIVRSSTPAEIRDYARMHWGRRGRGVIRQGGTAVGPFVRLGTAKSITYTTEKGIDRKLTDYVHPFGEGAPAAGFVPPKVLEHECTGGCGARCAARGSICLEGGSYYVTTRGIVG